VSRIGRKPVALPAGVKASMSGRDLVVEKGSEKLTQWVDPAIDVKVADGSIEFSRRESTDDQRERALHGLYRALAANMVEGLMSGFKKELRIEGVGFGAKLVGKDIELSLGFANAIRVKVPKGVTVEVPDPTKIVVKGFDKQKVGQTAAEIRQARPPEPYKGKGVRYLDEVVRRKQGKTVGATG
jgi:large subunit ribosomal protein L6